MINHQERSKRIDQIDPENEATNRDYPQIYIQGYIFRAHPSTQIDKNTKKIFKTSTTSKNINMTASFITLLWLTLNQWILTNNAFKTITFNTTHHATATNAVCTDPQGCEFICNSIDIEYVCADVTFQCKTAPYCSLQCNGQYSCNNEKSPSTQTKFICPKGGYCAVLVNNGGMFHTLIDGSVASELLVSASGSGAMGGAEMICPTKPSPKPNCILSLVQSNKYYFPVAESMYYMKIGKEQSALQFECDSKDRTTNYTNFFGTPYTGSQRPPVYAPYIQNNKGNDICTIEKMTSKSPTISCTNATKSFDTRDCVSKVNRCSDAPYISKIIVTGLAALCNGHFTLLTLNQDEMKRARALGPREKRDS